MKNRKISESELADLRDKPGRCVFYTDAYLQSALIKVIDSKSVYEKLLENLVEELLFRKFISSIQSSFDLAPAIRKVAPDYKKDEDLLCLKLPDIQKLPSPLRKALIRVENWCFPSNEDSVQAKVLVTLNTPDDKYKYRSELCLGFRFGRLGDNPCLDPSYSQEKSFEESVRRAEKFAAELARGCLGEDDLFRELLLSEPNLYEVFFQISGASASATLLFTHLVNYEYGLPSPPSATFSCAIDFESNTPVYKPVDGISRKVKAALAAGLKTLFVHEDNYEEAVNSLGDRADLLNLRSVSGAVTDNWREILTIFSETGLSNESELKRLLEEHAKFPRNSDIADKFWFSQVMPVKVQEMQRNWKKNGGETGIDCLICSVSRPDTVIQAYWCVLPKNLILVMGQTDEKNRKVLSRIERHILKNPFTRSTNRLEGPIVNIEITEYNKSYELYTRVNDSLHKYLYSDKKIYAEITGGTKPMTSVLAQYAWQHNMQTIYIRTDYDKHGFFINGTQELARLLNPKDILQEEELQQALRLFRSSRYDLAKGEFDSISEGTDSPKVSRFMAELSQLYHYRMLLNYDKAKESAENLKKQFDQKIFEFTPLDVQENLLKQINSFMQTHRNEFILVELFIVALQKAELGDYNVALILYYRFLEGVIALRLKGYGISNTGDPDYSEILKGHTKAELVKIWKEKLSPISQSFLQDEELPSRLGLFMGGALLDALEDEVVTGVGDREIVEVLYSLAELRNNSVLSHGYHSADKNKCSKFKRIATLFLKSSLKDYGEKEVDIFLKEMGFQRIHSIK